MTKQSNSSQVNTSEFMEAATVFGQKYLSCGGPTSRMENFIILLGKSCGFRSESFATPTGIFVSASPIDLSKEPTTSLIRVKSESIKLDEVVRLENVVSRFLGKQISFGDFKGEVQKNVEPLHPVILYNGAFLAGFASSLIQYNLALAAFLSGVITAMVAWFSGPFSERRGIGGIFSHFTSTLISFSLAGILSWKLSLPAESIAIGTFVLLVPGLLLTNAVSEIAEQNFVSGTAKIMKGVLILLALGTAYLLTRDIFAAVNPAFLKQISTHQKIQAGLGFRFMGILLLIGGFSVMFQIPKKVFPFALITGSVGWIVLQPFHQTPFFALGAFLPAFCVGLLSLIFGRFLKIPSQIFSVPGILSIVPGLLALSTFQTFTLGIPQRIPEIGFQVALVCASITFGLFSARIPFLFFGKKKFEEFTK